MAMMRTLTLTMSVFVLWEVSGNTLNWQLAHLSKEPQQTPPTHETSFSAHLTLTGCTFSRPISNSWCSFWRPVVVSETRTNRVGSLARRCPRSDLMKFAAWSVSFYTILYYTILYYILYIWSVSSAPGAPTSNSVPVAFDAPVKFLPSRFWFYFNSMYLHRYPMLHGNDNQLNNMCNIDRVSLGH